MNFKRKHSKRHVRCTLCTPFRWRGNRKGRRPDREAGLRRLPFKDVDARMPACIDKEGG